MTNSQMEWLKNSKTIFNMTNKIVAPLVSFTVVVASIHFSRYVTIQLTDSLILGDMVFFTVMFLFALNIFFSEFYNYLSSKLKDELVSNYLKNDSNGQNDSDRGHSRDDSGAGQPDSQDKTN